jgi:hypothetical protein
MFLPYGFEKLTNGKIRLNAVPAIVIQKIYQFYVDSASLCITVGELKSEQITAPSGKLKWLLLAVNKIQSNSKYVPNDIPI